MQGTRALRSEPLRYSVQLIRRDPPPPLEGDQTPLEAFGWLWFGGNRSQRRVDTAAGGASGRKPSLSRPLSVELDGELSRSKTGTRHTFLMLVRSNPKATLLTASVSVVDVVLSSCGQRADQPCPPRDSSRARGRTNRHKPNQSDPQKSKWSAHPASRCRIWADPSADMPPFFARERVEVKH